MNVDCAPEDAESILISYTYVLRPAYAPVTVMSACSPAVVLPLARWNTGGSNSARSSTSSSNVASAAPRYVPNESTVRLRIAN